MKTLMILGGSRFAIPVIDAAHRLGCRVVTCDYLPDNVAHRYADAYRNASVVDPEAVTAAARAESVDGILSFGCDPGVVTAACVAQRMGLPSCGPVESVKILQNKGLFRRFLAEHGFRVPMARSYASADEALADAGRFRWPVVVKPVDSAGSKGVRRADAPEELRSCADNALAFSRARAFIVEEYIAPKGFPSDSDSFFADGTLKFASFNCQHFDARAENPFTPSAYHWPSSLPPSSQAELKSEIERLLNLLHMGDSLYNIEAREDIDGRPCIMECSPRGGGNRLAECLEFATGVPLVENAVRAALGMPLTGLEQRPMRGYWAEVILHSRKRGVFRGLRVDARIEDAVFQRDLWIEPGARVGSFRAANEAIGTLILRFDGASRLADAMERLDELVRVDVQP